MYNRRVQQSILLCATSASSAALWLFIRFITAETQRSQRVRRVRYKPQSAGKKEAAGVFQRLLHSVLPRSYSYRKAIIGFTFVARRAGM